MEKLEIGARFIAGNGIIEIESIDEGYSSWNDGANDNIKYFYIKKVYKRQSYPRRIFLEFISRGIFKPCPNFIQPKSNRLDTIE